MSQVLATDRINNPTIRDSDALFVTPRSLVVRSKIHGRVVRFCVANPRDAIQRQHLKGEFYEEAELDIISRHFPIGGRLLDIGANVGNHTLYAGLFFHAREIVPIEPNPVAIELLKANIALNELDDVCDLDYLGIGLSDTDLDSGSIVPGKRNNLGGTKIDERGGDIAIRSVDSLLPDREFDLVKIDVEGLEMQVLNGMKGMIARCAPVIFVEIDNRNFDQLDQFCDATGYRIEAEYRRYRRNKNFLLTPKTPTD